MEVTRPRISGPRTGAGPRIAVGGGARACAEPCRGGPHVHRWRCYRPPVPCAGTWMRLFVGRVARGRSPPGLPFGALGQTSGRGCHHERISLLLMSTAGHENRTADAIDQTHTSAAAMGVHVCVEAGVGVGAVGIDPNVTPPLRTRLGSGLKKKSWGHNYRPSLPTLYGEVCSVVNDDAKLR